MLWLFVLPNYAQTPPPHAPQVFKLHLKVLDPNTALLSYQIKPGYFLYRERIRLVPADAQQSILSTPGLTLPPAETKLNAHGEPLAIYRHELHLPLHLQGLKPGEVLFQLHSQGCSDAGYCYPPQTHSLLLRIDQRLHLNAAELISAPAANHSAPAYNPFQNHWLISLSVFFGLGLLLSFSPCMLPMIPVLSGIIAGQKQHSARQAFLLSLSYVLGMSCSYALVGALIATLGQNLQVMMQSPWVISLYALFFLLLAFCLFNAYPLLPASWQSALSKTRATQAQRGYLGVAFMGMLSTLILSPCVTAPLIGALAYISRTGDILLGSAALFSLGLGMGLPLLIIGTSLGQWLPRAGPWMQRINQFFALLLVAVALMLFARLIPHRYATTAQVLTVTTLADNLRALKHAKLAGRAVFVDFYADWCESCQNIETQIERSPAIQRALKKIVLIRADVTRNDANSRALSAYFSVIAPPTLIFYNSQGDENQRLVGDVSTRALVHALETIQP